MMPLYEYKCEKHGRFEVLCKVASLAELPAKVADDGTIMIDAGGAALAPPELENCPKCGACSPRLLSAFARTPGRWKVDA